MGPALPFPLQDTEGRLSSVMRLYEHVGEQLLPRDGMAGEAIRHLHPHILPHNARCLRKPGGLHDCRIPPHEQCQSLIDSVPRYSRRHQKPLLPALKTYMPNISFEGTRDVRVLDSAKALWVAAWLHPLDMAMRGNELASETCDTSQHCLGCLLESFLVPTTHDLSFREVVVCCLYINQRDAQHRLNDLVTHRNRVRQELDDLIEAHRAASGSS